MVTFLLHKTAEIDDSAEPKVLALTCAFAAAECVASPVDAVHAWGVVPVGSDCNVMPDRSLIPSCGGLGAALSLALLALPSPGKADVLYKLQTQCSLKGGPAVPCVVEAVNDGDATLYRHQIGSQVVTVRISDAPVRMAMWDGAAKRWVGLRRAAALFSTNTVCFNGRELCAVNANYLNSVREDNPAATAKRDLVKVHFGADGRIDASCYDDGCEVTLK